MKESVVKRIEHSYSLAYHIWVEQMDFYDTDDFFEKTLKENERKRQKKQEKQDRLAQKKLLLENLQKVAKENFMPPPYGSLEWAYSILEAQIHDPIEKLKKNYLTLAQQFHPDRNAGIESQRMKDINHAWEIIRQRY